MLPFFYYFAGVTVLSAVLTVSLRNPVYCVLALMVMFFHVAGIFILLDAEFLAALQIIIYAGAILVLYLFVMMLLNVKSDERFVHRRAFVGVLLGLTLLSEVILLLAKSPFAAPAPPPPEGVVGHVGAVGNVGVVGNTEALGSLLFTDYLLPFELVGLLLLGGMIGALILAKEPPAADHSSRAPASMGPHG